jgi:hypothetical protein
MVAVAVAVPLMHRATVIIAAAIVSMVAVVAVVLRVYRVLWPQVVLVCLVATDQLEQLVEQQVKQELHQVVDQVVQKAVALVRAETVEYNLPIGNLK